MNSFYVLTSKALKKEKKNQNTIKTSFTPMKRKEDKYCTVVTVLLGIIPKYC